MDLWIPAWRIESSDTPFGGFAGAGGLTIASSTERFGLTPQVKHGGIGARGPKFEGNGFGKVQIGHIHWRFKTADCRGVEDLGGVGTGL